MKIYLAGNSGMIERESTWLSMMRARLLSYHFISTEQFAVKEAFETIKQTKK